MLVSSSQSAGWRVASLAIGTFLITAAGIGLAYLGARLGYWEWPPRPSGPFGVACGFALAGVVLFEMLILPRKWCRGWRLFRTKSWMKLHILIGLIGLPLVLVHSGFGFGGPLPAATMIFFLLVTFSGIWGLAMQQWLPQRILREVPSETIATQTEQTAQNLVIEADKLVKRLSNVSLVKEAVRTPSKSGRQAGLAPRLEPLVVGPAAVILRDFQTRQLEPYLSRGRRSRSRLASRTEAEKQFQRLRHMVPDEAEEIVDRLEELCDQRRQWDTLKRMNAWLHGWLLLHLPLSVAMTVLMVVHAIRALKYW